MRPSVVVSFAALMSVTLGAASQRDILPPTSGVTTKPLLRSTVSGDSAKESVVLEVKFEPGATTGLHWHPGDEYAAVLEGTLEIRTAGQPPRRIAAGQAYHNPQGIVHETRNVSDSIARTIATFIVEKGKPIVVPAQ